MLRSTILPLTGDEITYFKISENILNGKYYLNDYPSTIAPIVPIIFSLFKTSSAPLIGIVCHKLFNIGLTLLGLRYLYLFLEDQNLNRRIILAIVIFTIVNPISVSWFSALYPESVLFFLFWGFIYYSTSNHSNGNLFKTLLFFILLVFTRYVYAVLGVVLLMVYYDYIKADVNKYLKRIIIYSFIFLMPVIIWGKYLIQVEKNNLSEISYFNRFKIEHPILYNVKCGLGFEKHYEVSRVNGIPAFASLFIPKTGYRNLWLSVVLILMFLYGYWVAVKTLGMKRLLWAISLIMLGFVFAGTGFSRYWLVLLPGFYLGYYFILKSFGFKEQMFIYLVQIISFIYILNELRLDVLIVNQHL